MQQRFNIFHPDFLEDPYPFYEQLRRTSPVCQLDPGGMWAVTLYDDVQWVLKDTQFFSSEGFRPVWSPAWLGYSPIANSMLVMDGPPHTRLRGLVARAFSPRAIARLEARIRTLAEQLASNLDTGGEVEFVDAFAMPLPGLVIADLLGLDPALSRHFQRWSDATVSASPEAPAPEVIAELRASLDELIGYLRAVIDERRRAPKDDMVSDLIDAKIDGQSLSDSELIEFLALLLAAGFETTINVFGLTAIWLSSHPEHIAQLREQPALIPKFIEEMMRYDAPVQRIPRIVVKDVEIRGVRIPAGSLIIAVIGSANRDENRYPDPDRFDIMRGEGGINFGYGPHYCLGAPLARLEMQAGIEALVNRFRAFELRPGPIAWRSVLTGRAPSVLHLRAIA